MKLTTLSIVLTVFLAPIYAQAKSPLSGTIKVDGSSTVYPITEAIAEEFQKLHKRVRVMVGVSGTGGGFKKFLASETDINNASRVIKEKEFKTAKEKKIGFVEIPVAYDGLSVLVNKNNNFVSEMSFKMLKKLWEPGDAAKGNSVKKWSDLNPKWPNENIKLYGPGHDSGTFDYFTEAVNGKSKASRADFTASEDDNTLVRGISEGKFAIGYFGYAYYVENKDKLKALKIKEKQSSKAVAPIPSTIADGSYPLARPIFIYVNRKSLSNPLVAEFVKFYIKSAPKLAKEVGYIPLSPKMYNDSLDRINNKNIVYSFYKKNGSSVKK